MAPLDEPLDFNQITKPNHQTKYRVNHLNDIASMKMNNHTKKLEKHFNLRVAEAEVSFQHKNALLSQEKRVKK
jgi:hypothetical protein